MADLQIQFCLAQSLNADQWMRPTTAAHNAQHVTDKEKLTLHFTELKHQDPQLMSQTTLDHNTLMVNLRSRHPMEEEVFSPALPFAIAPI